MVAKEERNIRYDLPIWLWWDKVSKTSYRLVGNTFVGSEMGIQKSAPYVVATFISLLIMGLISALKSKNLKHLNLILILIFSMSVLGIYQENIHMHYIEFAIPLVILSMVGLMGVKSYKLLKIAAFIFIIFCVYIGATRSYHYISSGSTHQAEKARLIAEYIVKKANNRAYNVVSTQGMYTTPFQYFLAISDNRPSNKLEKIVYDICAGEPCPEDDQTTTLLFLTGPGHPSIANYLGHPEMNSFDGKRTMVSNEHVFIGIWVAEIVLE
jgi:membrane-associated HD superfamily phosphohydrolase